MPRFFRPRGPHIRIVSPTLSIIFLILFLAIFLIVGIVIVVVVVRNKYDTIWIEAFKNKQLENFHKKHESFQLKRK